MGTRKVLTSSSLAVGIILALVGLGLWGLRGRGEKPGAPLGRNAPRDEVGASSPIGAGVEGKDAGGSEAADAAVPVPEEVPVGPEAGPGLPISIEGRVTDGSGAGVAGARVVAVGRAAWTGAMGENLRRLGRDPLRGVRALQESCSSLIGTLPSTRTGEDGSYALRGLEDGEHRVVVTHADFLPYHEEAWVLVETGRIARHDVELVEGHAISGRVHDSEGRPVAGARVAAEPSEVARLRGIGKMIQTVLDQTQGKILLESGRSETDAMGAFRLASLEPGTHDIRVEKEGYAWGVARGVPAGTEGVLIGLEAGIRVTGRLLGPDRKPIAGAEVILRDPERDFNAAVGPMALALADIDVLGERERHAGSDEDGLFVLEAFAQGLYELVARADGFPERRVPLNLDRGGASLGDILLSAGKEISGRVVSPQGAPIAGARVWVPKPTAGNSDPDFRRSEVLGAGPATGLSASETDAGGAFRLPGLDGSAHEVAVLAADFPGKLIDGVRGGRGNLQITLEQGIRVTGRVVELETGEPVPAAKVAVGWSREGEVLAADDGSFEVRGVSREGWARFGGKILIRARQDGYQESNEMVEVPAAGVDATQAVELRLRRLAVDGSGLGGFVLDDRGEPVVGARVWVEVPGIPRAILDLEAGVGSAETRSAEDGSFVLPTPRVGGGMVLEVVAAQPGFAKARVGPLTRPTGGARWPTVEIRLSVGTTLEGRVTGTDGVPLAGARVRAWRDVKVSGEALLFTQLLPRPEGETAYSAKDGSYRLRALEAGSYRIEARAHGYATRNLGPLEVGGETAQVDLVLDAGGSLRGRVIDLAGGPLSGIEVVAFPNFETSGPRRPLEEELLQLGALGVAATRTGGDGLYELTHLPEGEFRIVARAAGFEPAVIPKASAGQELPDMVLAPYASLSGRVLDAETGAPVRSFGVRLERRSGDTEEYVVDHELTRNVDDPEGLFEYDALRSGEWRVHVVTRDHVEWQRAVVLSPGRSTDLDVLLSPGSRIEGRVRREDGTPIAGARLQAQGKRNPMIYDWEHQDAVSSDEEGRFVIQALEDGQYRIVASHPDYYADGELGSATVEVPTVEPRVLDLVLKPAGRVAGRIRGLAPPTGGEISYYAVLVPIADDRGGGGPGGRDAGAPAGVASAPDGPMTWISPGDGNYRLDSVRPGRYRLELLKRSWRRTQGASEPDPPERRALGEVEVRVGETARLDASAD